MPPDRGGTCGAFRKCSGKAYVTDKMNSMDDAITVSEVREVKQDAEDEIASAVRRTLDELREELGTEADQLSVSLKTVTKTDGSEHVVGVDVDLSLDI